MQRREYICTSMGIVGAVSLAGCSGILPNSSQNPPYPGGTLVVENTGDNPVRVSVKSHLERYDASLDAEVGGGERVVRREFVTADEGEVVTLAAQLGETGEPRKFQFLPAGTEESPPEVAQLTFENAVEASARWTATSGT